MNLNDLGIVTGKIRPGGITYITIKGDGTYIMPSAITFSNQESPYTGVYTVRLILLDQDGDYLDSEVVYNQDTFWSGYRRLLNELMFIYSYEDSDIPIVRRGKFTSPGNSPLGCYTPITYLTKYTSVKSLKSHLAKDIMLDLIECSTGHRIKPSEANARMYISDIVDKAMKSMGVDRLAKLLQVSTSTIRGYRSAGALPYDKAIMINGLIVETDEQFYNTLWILNETNPKSLTKRHPSVIKFAKALRKLRICNGVKTNCKLFVKHEIDICRYEHGKSVPDNETLELIIACIDLETLDIGANMELLDGYERDVLDSYKSIVKCNRGN